MRENKTCPYQGWKQIPTEELDKILQAELEKDHPNEEVVLPILHELEEREKDYPIEKTPDNLALVEKLKEHNTSSMQSKHRRGWIAGVAAVAAAVCIIVMALPRTVGAESVFDVLFRWTSSIFEFVDPDKSEPKPESGFTTEHPGLQQLYDKLTELGITNPVVPTWLPKGFVLSDLSVDPVPGGNNVHAQFNNDNTIFLITYRIATKITSSMEKEETGVELFESSGVNHFIIENEGMLSVTWVIDGVECVINTGVLKKDLYTIIKSIYRSELP